MSCLVPMKKPRNCYEYGGCPLFDKQFRVCKVAKVDYYDFDKQYANCPLVEVKEGEIVNWLGTRVAQI